MRSVDAGNQVLQFAEDIPTSFSRQGAAINFDLALVGYRGHDRAAVDYARAAASVPAKPMKFAAQQIFLVFCQSLDNPCRALDCVDPVFGTAGVHRFAEHAQAVTDLALVCRADRHVGWFADDTVIRPGSVLAEIPGADHLIFLVSDAGEYQIARQFQVGLSNQARDLEITRQCVLHIAGTAPVNAAVFDPGIERMRIIIVAHGVEMAGKHQCGPASLALQYAPDVGSSRRRFAHPHVEPEIGHAIGIIFSEFPLAIILSRRLSKRIHAGNSDHRLQVVDDALRIDPVAQLLPQLPVDHLLTASVQP